MILVMVTRSSLANVKARLSAVVASVHDTHERVVITRNGEPAAILIAPDDLEALEETLDVLGNDELVQQIAQAQAEISAGETVQLTELRRGRPTACGGPPPRDGRSPPRRVPRSVTGVVVLTTFEHDESVLRVTAP
jgi:antitoxin YefM